MKIIQSRTNKNKLEMLMEFLTSKEHDILYVSIVISDTNTQVYDHFFYPTLTQNTNILYAYTYFKTKVKQ
jgi:hypothetical protein